VQSRRVRRLPRSPCVPQGPARLSRARQGWVQQGLGQPANQRKDYKINRQGPAQPSASRQNAPPARQLLPRRLPWPQPCEGKRQACRDPTAGNPARTGENRAVPSTCASTRARRRGS
jgi:hypothetical protein